MEIRHINTPRISEWWPHVEGGIARALDRSHGLNTMDNIYDHVSTGQWGLWVVIDGNTLLGGCITEPQPGPTGFWINIPFLWSDDPHHNFHQELMEHLAEQGRQGGYVGLRFISSRPGYARRAAQLGFEQRFVEYIKDIRN